MDIESPLHIIIDAIPTISKTWIDVSLALLTPVIAIITGYIAYQQYKVNEMRLRHESYERKFRVYKAVQAFLSEILVKGDVGYNRCYQFYAEASEANFIFDKSVQKFIDSIYNKAIDMHNLRERLYPSDGSPGLPRGEERDKVANENIKLSRWLIEQLPISRELFRKHMGIK